MAKQKGSAKTGGRQKGTPNKATADLRLAFRRHGAALVKALLLLTKSTDERVRLGAIQAAFDRGWGKAPQPQTGEGGEGPIQVFINGTDAKL